MLRLLCCLFLVGAATAQGPIVVDNYAEFVDYVGDGYFGAIGIDASRCTNSPGVTPDLLLNAKVFFGTRTVNRDEDIDNVAMPIQFINSDGTFVAGNIVLDSSGFSNLEAVLATFPSFETVVEFSILCEINDGIQLFVYGSDEQVFDYQTYDDVKFLFENGLETGVFLNGGACEQTPSLAGYFTFSNAVEWSVRNAGTAEESMVLEAGAIGRVRNSEGEMITANTWTKFTILPSGEVFINQGAYDVTGTSVLNVMSECRLGPAFAAKTFASVQNSLRFDSYEDIIGLLLSGKESFLVIDTTQCTLDPNGDDILGDTTVLQKRFMVGWEWYAQTPQGVSGVQSHWFWFGEDDVDGTYTIHENVDLSEDGNAYIHLSYIDMAAQTYNTSVLTCPLGSGVYLTTPRLVDRTELTTVEEVLDRARQSDYLNVHLYTEFCTDEVGNALPEQIFMGYMKDTEADLANEGDAMNYRGWKMQLDPVTFEGFAVATIDVTMSTTGDFFIRTNLWDAGTWIGYNPLTFTCPFTAAKFFVRDPWN